jgi:D-threo-aldose 1-dehydrogenase
MELEYDAVQKISYQGILECWEQGCELLGQKYKPQIVSVHDPDEYLAQASTQSERKNKFDDIIAAYQALIELKQNGQTKAVGIGAKNWKVIQEITKEIDLDWVMLAVSFTVYSHPPALIDFIDELTDKQISIINSAVFHAGFLTGGKYFDYRILNPEREEDKPYFSWRKKFFALCNQYRVKPADVCVQFAQSHPGVISIALNTSKPERVEQNIASVMTEIPHEFWQSLKQNGLISRDYSYLG